VSAPRRALVLAPRGRDAQVIRNVLNSNGVDALVCDGVPRLLEAMDEGAACVLFTAESVLSGDIDLLAHWIARQPPWSDFPFIVLAPPKADPPAAMGRAGLGRLGNVMLLERPLRTDTLHRAVAAALRARERQYKGRAQLLRQTEAEEALRVLNETLETRISERTHALARANDRLMKEIRERERTQSALVQSQKMEAIGQLTGGLAHDFNNLLNVILGSVELITRSQPEERVRRLAANAKHAVERGAKLTAQLLAFSRSQNLDLRPTDVNDLLAGMRDLMALSLGPTVRIATDFACCMPMASADANQLELAVLNLAINARDAMPSGGEVTLTTAVMDSGDGDLPPGRFIVVSVSDTGTGIAPEALNKVFDPFFTTKPVGKGTGLGLSQVYGIARQSGGTARIHSVLGKGTVVEIWLAISTANNQVEAGQESKPEAAGGTATVLVIDDDAVVRNLIVECLQILGYDVRQAADGVTGLRLLREQPPDLLMVDFIMPVLSGAEVIEQAREVLPDLPIILATGYADAQVSGALLERERVLQKPFNIDQLASMVADALQRPA
jgi:signal transduction histidine kinase